MNKNTAFGRMVDALNEKFKPKTPFTVDEFERLTESSELDAPDFIKSQYPAGNLRVERFQFFRDHQDEFQKLMESYLNPLPLNIAFRKTARFNVGVFLVEKLARLRAKSDNGFVINLEDRIELEGIRVIMDEIGATYKGTINKMYKDSYKDAYAEECDKLKRG